MIKHISRCILIVAGIGFATAAHAQGKILRVCFGEFDAPRADKTSGKGFDMEVMRAVAANIGRTLQPVWVEQEEKMTDAESSDLPLPELSRGQCDAVASIPGRDSLRGAKGALALSRPYYGAGFEFVAAPGGPEDFSEMKGKRIVIQYMTVGHLAVQAAGLTWIGAASPEGQIAELQAGRADAALVWGPSLGPLKQTPKQGTLPAQSLRWNEHVATREADAELGKAIDAALEKMLASGEIAKLMQAHGIPPHPPFEAVFDQLSLLKLQLHR
ncbi:MAG TPA: transporter substrate-binding domain-containing protein [Alphaproteobacteria bacterium]|nr:transporter substrate-binding domain-containing protein [Alphaproteobacteria bacterium]